MLPRWLTALPRLASTYRDEILVVALGLVYQAGVTHGFSPRDAHRHESEHVVVRIAEGPHASMRATERALVAAEAAAVAAEAELAAVQAAAALPHMAHLPHAAPRPPRPPMPRARVLPPRTQAAPAPVPVPSASVVRGGRATIARTDATRDVRVMVTADAGENIAAAMGVRAGTVDTAEMPEIRRTLELLRPAIDEARIRAAIQKALAAEQAAARLGQGRGA